MQDLSQSRVVYSGNEHPCQRLGLLQRSRADELSHSVLQDQFALV